jgi:hypothetical protein
MSDIKRATVRMEEGYMRLTIKYNNPTDKTKICKNVANLEQKLDVYPEVIHRRDSKEECFSSIEFSGEDYICSRTCGEFIERLIHDLGIEKCDND